MDKDVKEVNKEEFINTLRNSPSRGFTFQIKTIKFIYTFPHKAQLRFVASGKKKSQGKVLLQELTMEFGFIKQHRQWLINKAIVVERNISSK